MYVGFFVATKKILIIPRSNYIILFQSILFLSKSILFIFNKNIFTFRSALIEIFQKKMKAASEHNTTQINSN